MFTHTSARTLRASHAAAIALPSRGYTTIKWEDFTPAYMGGILADIVSFESDTWDEITVHTDGRVVFTWLADFDDTDAI